jgi:hypothetical protein
MIEKTKDTITVRTETVKTYSVKELEKEKNALLASLDIAQPDDKELIELGKLYHPYYESKSHIEDRINELNNLLR